MAPTQPNAEAGCPTLSDSSWMASQSRLPPLQELKLQPCKASFCKMRTMAPPGATESSGVPLDDSRVARAPRRARKRVEGGASSNVFSMFDQSQIQEFKEAFTIMDQNRDGFIDKEDLRDTFAALGRINVKNEELEAMVKEAPGAINFTVFLTMFGEKLKGTDPEETILHAFKVFDTEGKGFVKADLIKEKLMTQADRFSEEEVKQMFAAFPPDMCGNLDYRNLCYVITHGEEKD
ncbi:Myosin regulatory light chain 10 [Sciurus carolinensis]|uniref:Myosin regulatory light chain 10 n=2 Tax=Sciurus carolinensis TaxID=30640 RepID=A0AA41N7C1_SCICA|nr:Myosin regulatory light chain 10 [Sciurus carolinensis]